MCDIPGVILCSIIYGIIHNTTGSLSVELVVHSMPGTGVKFNHNTPCKFFSSCREGKLGTTIGSTYGGVVDDVECLLGLDS